MSTEAGGDQPVLKVISPNTTAEEIAAILAVLAAVGSAPPDGPAPSSRWAGRSRSSWKGSGRPQ